MRFTNKNKGLDASMRTTNILYENDEVAKFIKDGEKKTFLSSKGTFETMQKKGKKE